jgi:hypothetical protein
MTVILGHHHLGEELLAIADQLRHQSREDETIVTQDLHHRKGAGGTVRWI